MSRLFWWLLTLRVVSIIFCISPLAPLFTNINDGFALSKITSNLPYRADWEVSPPSAEVTEALKQNYSYLGKGAQSYAFASADGHYVLKLFKHQHLKEPFWNHALPQQKRRASAYRKRTKLETLFNSYKIAYEELSQETGVLFAHLNTNDNLSIETTIVDMMGRRHPLDLDKTTFVLQRKATLITKAIQSATPAKAQQIIHRAIETTISRCKKGYIDTDPAFIQNWGVTADGTVIQIDAGRVVKKDNFPLQERVSQETAQLRQWCDKNLIW